MKHETICNNYENGSHKNADISITIRSIQCSWEKMFFEKIFHDWKLIPRFLINKYLKSKTFKFHECLHIYKVLLSKFPTYYQDILIFKSLKKIHF